VQFENIAAAAEEGKAILSMRVLSMYSEASEKRTVWEQSRHSLRGCPL